MIRVKTIADKGKGKKKIHIAFSNFGKSYKMFFKQISKLDHLATIDVEHMSENL